MNINKKSVVPFLTASAILLSPTLIFAADSSYFPICDCCTSATTPCTLKNFFEVVSKLIKAVLYLSFFIAVLMIIKGGITIILGADKPGEVTKGRETVTWAIYGMLIAFGAWLIINTVLTIFTGEGVSTYLTF
jgi:type IV secretory pathway VirB2 component (pilin)